MHKKSITAIAWSPYDIDLIVSASIDGIIVIYDVANQCVVSTLDNCCGGCAPCSIAWGSQDNNSIMFIGGRGPLVIWSRKEDSGRIPGISSHTEARGFSSDVCLMRCHPSHPDQIALGHVDGSISLFVPGKLQLQNRTKQLSRRKKYAPSGNVSPIRSLD